MKTKQNDRQQNRRELMLNEPVSKVIPKMALPTIVAFLISSIYSLADTHSPRAVKEIFEFEITLSA